MCCFQVWLPAIHHVGQELNCVGHSHAFLKSYTLVSHSNTLVSKSLSLIEHWGSNDEDQTTPFLCIPNGCLFCKSPCFTSYYANIRTIGIYIDGREVYLEHFEVYHLHVKDAVSVVQPCFTNVKHK